jgi:type II secretory pathway pseudopilin PulG
MTVRARRQRESGAILIIFMVVIAVGAIALTAAAQAWSTTWRRDSEEELIFRANQYVLGIIAYRKEHGGQFPLRLEELHKPGPRRLRYVRKLYKDPLAKDGKWGLLYLMPGGQGVYDPKAAQVAQEKAKKEWGKGWESAGTGNLQQMPGVTPLKQNPMGAGVPGTGGMPPGSLPPGMSGAMPMIPPPAGGGDGGLQLSGDEESVTEPPIGWPIVGVISRATGKAAADTFRIYKGHEQVDEWQFHVFDLGEQMQAPGSPNIGPTGPGSIGPGFGGRGAMGGVGGGVQPGMMRGRGANVRDYMQQGSEGGRGKRNFNPQNPYGNDPNYNPQDPYGNNPNTFYPPGTSPPKQKGEQQGGDDQGNP